MTFGVFIAAGMLLAASNNENSWRRLTWQPYDEEESSGLLLGCLALAPIIILFAVAATLLGLQAFRWLGLLAFNVSI